ncbi:MAG: hypothetical protein RLZZ385_2459 [Pseudomonadota bacterium]|jgi:cyclopropane-fatty-acyl-phospholipid synthase
MNQKTLSLNPAMQATVDRTATKNRDDAGNWIRDSLLGILARANQGHLLLREHGVVIGTFGDADAELQAEIDIVDNRVYKRALLGGDAAAGEAYVDGWWTSPDITAVTRFFSRNLDMMDAWKNRFGWLLKPIEWQRRIARLNSKSQAKRNILSHYDLGNSLYETFLDPHMQYSSALFETDADSLQAAQERKLRRICNQLDLQPTDHLLEIGTGWGGLAIFAARHYGCRVTTTTISDEQFDYARAAVESAGLADRVTLLNQDYRELRGSFDKLVSVEMIEAVGRRFLPGYFRQLNELLKPGGLMMLQAITIADQRFETYAAGEDFIQKHIFPGGFLPSLKLLTHLLSDETSMVVRNIHDMGLDYARTLRQWRNNFMDRCHEVEQMGYNQRFRRLWEYYMAYCEGGFLERRISTVQLLASKAPHF